MRAGIVAVTLLGLLVAGCAVPAAEEAATPAAATLPTAPRVDARETLAQLKEFSEAFPYRQSGQAAHLEAREWLVEALTDSGLEVLRQPFPGPFGLYDGENLIGIKWGADRSRWVVVGSHYDITEGAVHGAYDDGSGVAMTLRLAEAFASVETTRTIAFVLFDQEERGVVGSKHFVTSIVEGTFELPDVAVDAMIDLDMVGITWPHPAHLVCWENSGTLRERIQILAADVGIPEENLEFREPRTGSSDGAAFIAAGIPTAYFFSNWDDVVTKDGTPLPVPYPFWHQVDTYDTMVAAAGDEETLAAGFQTVLDVASPLIAFAASAAFTS